MSVLKEKMGKYIKQFKQKDENIILIEHIENIIKEFSKDTFIITDKFELTYLQGEIDSIKEIIKTS
jgi:5-methylcytosine-specific restriction endonuclease McrBC GTP-binding regulatory subunit McrB